VAYFILYIVSSGMWLTVRQAFVARCILDIVSAGVFAHCTLYGVSADVLLIAYCIVSQLVCSSLHIVYYLSGLGLIATHHVVYCLNNFILR